MMSIFGNIAFVLIFLVGAIHVYFKHKFNYWKERGVPHRKPSIPLGNIIELLFYKKSPADYFAELYNEFEAPYIGFYSLSSPYLLIKDVELIKNILIKDFNAFPNRSFFADEKIDTIISNSLFGIRVPQWKELRNKLSPVFTSGKLKLMLPLMMECGKNLQDHIVTMLDQNLEMKEVAARYTTDVISSCAFGLLTNCFKDDNKFRHNARLLFPNTTIRALKSMSYIFAPTLVKIFKYSFVDDEATNYFRQIFEHTLKTRDQNKIRRNDLVDILNDIKKNEKCSDTLKFDGDRILAQALVFFGAGQETTSGTIAFTLHELSLNQDIQEKLREEIQNEIQKQGALTYEAIQDMKYLDMVISETLRKYPLTPVISRVAAEDYEYEKTGLKIDKGTNILISQPALHWDSRYFPQPDKYDPERFSDENQHKIPNYVYLPFGAGPRICIGERFALLSSKLGIIYIINNFKVVANSQTRDPIVFGRSLLLQPTNGIPLTCTKDS